MTWDDVIKVITILAGTGTLLAAIGGVFIWIFKQWVLNIFKKDLAQQENRLNENLKQKELNWIKDNKEIELRINEEIRRTELQLTKTFALEQRHFDVKIQAFQNSWNNLIELGDYVINEYGIFISTLNPKHINEFVYPLRKKCHSIRKELLFLPEGPFKLVSELIDNLFEDISVFLKRGEELSKDIVPDKEGRRISDPKSMEILNAALNKLQNNVHERINNIRDEFQKSYLAEIEQKPIVE
jgi:hypothetical protein